VWISGNIYYGKALHYEGESSYVEKTGFLSDLEVIEDGDNVYLNLTIDSSGPNLKTQFITTEMLGKAKMPKEGFENPDGTSLKIDTDYLGNRRSESNPSAGPFENPGKGTVKLKVW